MTLLGGDPLWAESLERQLAHLSAGAHVCPLYDAEADERLHQTR